MSPFRIVIIGIGAVAEAIAQSIAELPNATLLAGSCRTRSKGETFAAKHDCRWRDDAYYGPGRWQGSLALDGGGALINQAIHYVDLAQWIAAAAMNDLSPSQNPVEEVFAYTAKRAHDPKQLEVEDTAVAMLRFR